MSDDLIKGLVGSFIHNSHKDKGTSRIKYPVCFFICLVIRHFQDTSQHHHQQCHKSERFVSRR
ncbi:Uncharacterized protein APZ42_024224 [Daphnia magna]|uniref:Uncharacterized protein n=1 Tax=Daphnia magna TaxID=35525 RepID=A0A164UJ47_9CRUS|nr:Uncharacterized protein APZ42_024224 [Daphnia magna]